ncbi:hypothetical protein [Bradyrhizobium sp. 186]|uniref:hypothetical protein n=1 Tax=Bradyrhizobium sp. 186 TaxID=2782654 RepID=UPI002000CBF7|nr:hypothetical protein [Bradyrhizobium sp. 186]
MNLGVKGTVPLHLFEKLATTWLERCSSNVGKGPQAEFSETLCRLAISASTGITFSFLFWHYFSGVFTLAFSEVVMAACETWQMECQRP